jgi:hypothetical protein
MLNLRYAPLLALGCAIAAQAATREDYALEMQKYLESSLGRTRSSVSNILDETKKINTYGRGEIMIIRPVLSTGLALDNQDFISLARRIMLASNKVVVDAWDDPKQTSLSQVAFSLYELVYAYEEMKARKMLPDADLTRTETMLKACADYWLRERPKQGNGNLDMRYALGVAAVANTFPKETHAAKWRTWSEATFNNILYFPDGVVRARPTPGITENCNGYVGATTLAWICLGEALGKRAEMTAPEVNEWLDGFYQQVMPNGVIPVYGDSSWGPTGEWLGIFEWMGHVFKKPEYRLAAQRLFDYGRKNKAPFADTSEAIRFMDESVPLKETPRGSLLTRRRAEQDGKLIPDKIILRGHGDNASQPYVFLHAMNGGGHSHPHGGAVGAYALGDSVILHDFGYDAIPSVFHNMLNVRPVSESFPGYFGDPAGQLLDKIDKDGVRITTHIPSPERVNTDAACVDFAQVSYGRLSYSVTTGWEKDRSFNGRLYGHTREVALEKTTGILVVFDSLDLLTPGELTAGPVWHAQEVLAKNDAGYLVEDKNPASIQDVLYTCSATPVWMALAGPGEKTTMAQQTWQFIVRRGREREMQKEHLLMKYSGPGEQGKKLCFLTVFAPQPKGSKTIPGNVHAQVSGNQAVGVVGDWEFRFGLQKLTAPESNGQAVRFIASRKTAGQASYTAAVQMDKDERFEWEKR